MKKMILVLILMMIGLAACNEGYSQGYYVNYSSYENYAADEDYEVYDCEYNYEYTSEYEALTGFVDDAIVFIEFVEGAHPIFVMPEILPQDYYERRDEFVQAAQEAESHLDFYFAMMQYLTVLRDEHMSMMGFTLLSNYYLDTELIARDNRLFLLADGEVTLEVVKVGEIPVKLVLETIDMYFYHENEAARNRTHAVMARGKEMLQRAGAEFGQDTATITLEDGEVHIAQVVENTAWRLKGIVGSNEREFIINYGMINDDVFLVDVRTFQDDPGFIRAERDIRRAVNEGVRYFVFDVRNNTGGNSSLAWGLLNAMGITPPSFGSVVRGRSALNPEQPEIAVKSPPSLRATNNPNDVIIAVLTNANTLSSARWVSAWVQDGDLGVVIGEPGANAGTAFGNLAARAILPYTQLRVSSSTHRWIRPDAYADQSTIWPDIYVPHEEALVAALEFFANID